MDSPAAGDANHPPSAPETVGNPPGMPRPTTPDDDILGGGAQEPPTARASDRRPQVEAKRAQQLAAGDFDDLASLEAEAKRLEALARELESRAKALESKVRELE